MPCRVVIAIADGFTDSGLSIALDVFRTANSLVRNAGRPALFQVEVVSAGGGAVGAASGMRLESTAKAAKCLGADIVLVPGLWVESPVEMERALERRDVKKLVRTLGAAWARGSTVGSSCDGAFLLAEAGILDGKKATTTWWLAPFLKRRRRSIEVTPNASLVVADRVVTAGAVFAQADLCLHFVARVGGPTLARECANVLLLDTHGSQSAYMAVNHFAGRDPSIARMETWLRKHLSERVSVGALARQAGVGARTLSRRLQTAMGANPIRFVQRVRLQAAVQMLETTAFSLEEISARVGYTDSSSLRRLLRRELRASPLQIRRRFRGS